MPVCAKSPGGVGAFVVDRQRCRCRCRIAVVSLPFGCPWLTEVVNRTGDGSHGELLVAVRRLAGGVVSGDEVAQLVEELRKLVAAAGQFVESRLTGVVPAAAAKALDEP
jgi:hypothetical protein